MFYIWTKNVKPCSQVEADELGRHRGATRYPNNLKLSSASDQVQECGCQILPLLHGPWLSDRRPIRSDNTPSYRHAFYDQCTLSQDSLLSQSIALSWRVARPERSQREIMQASLHDEGIFLHHTLMPTTLSVGGRLWTLPRHINPRGTCDSFAIYFGIPRHTMGHVTI